MMLVAGTVLFLCIAFTAAYFTRFRTMASIKRLSAYADGYDIYAMDVCHTYSIDDIIASGYTDTRGVIDAVVSESLPFIPVRIDVPAFGCSAFSMRTEDGTVLTGRNYDFRLDTSAMLVHCTPKDGYESIAFAALNNIGADHATAGLAKRLACLTAPFICLDGINEKGVSIAVLTLDSVPTVQDTGKPKLATSLIIRLVLDRAATTKEAVSLLGGYDMLAVMGMDYHFIINDATGDSVAVEFDCDSSGRRMTVTSTDAITNFYVMHIDKVFPKRMNGAYGHGKERYDAIMAVIGASWSSHTRGTAWEALVASSRGPDPAEVTSNTQWSIVFDNTHRSAEITLRRHWDERRSVVFGNGKATVR